MALRLNKAGRSSLQPGRRPGDAPARCCGGDDRPSRRAAWQRSVKRAAPWDLRYGKSPDFQTDSLITILRVDPDTRMGTGTVVQRVQGAAHLANYCMGYHSRTGCGTNRAARISTYRYRYC
eukprot:6187250-Pleurochrysis_carterae.AAC.3